MPLRALGILVFLVLSGCNASPSPSPLPAPSASPAPSAGPPVAPVRPVVETYFGTTVVDPYRWLERLDDPETRAWIKGQSAYARRTLAALPLRQTLFARIEALDADKTEVWQPQRWGQRLFYLKTAPGKQSRSLFVRETPASTERLLVDADALSTKEKHVTIDWAYPSPDGELVAYGISPSGSEDSVLHVVETATGRTLSEAIDRTSEAMVAWIDGRTFTYPRLQKLLPGAPVTARYQRSRVYLHAVGQDAERDSPVFGWGLSPSVPMDEDDNPYPRTAPGSDWVLGFTRRGMRPELSIYAAPRASLAGAETPWKKIADADADEVTDFRVRGDEIFLMTHHDAPRFKVIAASLAHPDLAGARVVIPESEAVIQSLAVGRDALYAAMLDGALGHLTRVPLDGKGGRIETAELPEKGTIDMLWAHPQLDGALFQLRTWTTDPRPYEWRAGAKTVTDLGLVPPSSAASDALVADEVMVKSTDGTRVPLSIVHARDVARDGKRPTWLEGYGAYGLEREPSFSPTQIAWLERGGVFAVCHVRGGGEYGDAWHRAGMKANKERGIEDFFGCARYLVEVGLTAPAHLAAVGASAGGVLIGGAITRKPELFAAALIKVGITNVLRFETGPNGPSNVPEYGSVKTEEGFRALLVQDAYSHVVDHTPYPAVLLTGGMADAEVPPWQPAKMAARLQAATSSGRPVLLRVDEEVGHGLYRSTRAQQHANLADQYAFLLAALGAGGEADASHAR